MTSSAALCGHPLSHARRRLLVLSWVLGSMLAAVSPAHGDTLLDAQRILFVEVEGALKAGNRAPLKRHGKTLQNYPLYPYLIYRDLRLRLASASRAEITGFLNTYGGSAPVAEKLRHRWLAQLAQRARWADFLEYYQESATVENQENRCHHATALIRAGLQQQAREWVRALWAVDFSQPAACDVAFKWGFENRVLSDAQVWERMLLVWARGREGLFNYLSRQLGADARRWSKPLREGRYHPERTALKMREQLDATPYAQDIMAFALRRMARKDVTQAGALWSRIRRDCERCGGLRTLERVFGITAAQRLMPSEAYRWLSQLPPAERNDESRYWRVRAALRMQSWERVLTSLDDLQGEAGTFPQWRYWRAHALAALGQRTQAQVIWRQLASTDGYYGYLAADRLGSAYPHALGTLTYSAAQMAELGAYPAIARIRELVALDRLFDASRELLLLLESLDRPTRSKLAVAADRWGWPIGAIRALADGNQTPHLRERFPMPYLSIVAKESRSSQVPMAWIYAIMRRESAFVERIKSPAGALGLMQLRPGTARAMANRLGIGRISNHRILSPQLNVRLGVAYIKRLYDRHGGNLAHSLAAYNAGPSNVRRWLNTAPVAETAIWVDTIPYDETRLYVRAVLFYTLVYHQLLGKPPLRLRELMESQAR